MIRTDFSVEPANWETDKADLLAIRTQVFFIEQKVPRDEEQDALDPDSHHMLARDTQGCPIGTGRLTPEHTIGRMAVLREWRGKHVGETILRRLLERARELRYPAIELPAHNQTIRFYAKFGFEPYGEAFEDSGIPHQMMRLALQLNTYKRPPAPLTERPEARAFSVEGHAQAIDAVAELLALARYELAIYSRDLDSGLLDEAHILEAIKKVALSGRNAQIRVIVQEPRKAMTNDHPLIALAQRLPSLIAIRTPSADEDLKYPCAFLLNDCRGYLLRPLASRYDGEGNTYAPGRQAQLLEYFDQVWERSIPSEELRQLSI